MKTIEVVSKSNGSVSLTDPKTRIGRVWKKPGDVILLTEEEIYSMSAVPGGMYIFKNYLIIKDEKVVRELFREEIEPEYFYDKETIISLLKTGTEDQLADALEFGGEGVITLIKDCAIELRLYDPNKRKMISDASGFDLNTIIDNLIKIEQEEEDAKKGSTPKIVIPEATQRRRAAKPFVSKEKVSAE